MTTRDTAYFKSFGTGYLPGLLGVEILKVEPGLVESRLAVRREVMAPNDFLHAATVIDIQRRVKPVGQLGNRLTGDFREDERKGRESGHRWFDGSIIIASTRTDV